MGVDGGDVRPGSSPNGEISGDHFAREPSSARHVAQPPAVAVVHPRGEHARGVGTDHFGAADAHDERVRIGADYRHLPQEHRIGQRGVSGRRDLPHGHDLRRGDVAGFEHARTHQDVVSSREHPCDVRPDRDVVFASQKPSAVLADQSVHVARQPHSATGPEDVVGFTGRTRPRKLSYRDIIGSRRISNDRKKPGSAHQQIYWSVPPLGTKGIASDDAVVGPPCTFGRLVPSVKIMISDRVRRRLPPRHDVISALHRGSDSAAEPHVFVADGTGTLPSFAADKHVVVTSRLRSDPCVDPDEHIPRSVYTRAFNQHVSRGREPHLEPRLVNEQNRGGGDAEFQIGRIGEEDPATRQSDDERLRIGGFRLEIRPEDDGVRNGRPRELDVRRDVRPDQDRIVRVPRHVGRALEHVGGFPEQQVSLPDQAFARSVPQTDIVRGIVGTQHRGSPDRDVALRGARSEHRVVSDGDAPGRNVGAVPRRGSDERPELHVSTGVTRAETHRDAVQRIGSQRTRPGTDEHGS